MPPEQYKGPERRQTNPDLIRIFDKLESVVVTMQEFKDESKDKAEKIDAIYKAMYIGNGKPCIMERLTGLETSKKIVYSILGAIGVSTLGFIFAIILKKI